jgi:hypothetical protein
MSEWLYRTIIALLGILVVIIGVNVFLIITGAAQ